MRCAVIVSDLSYPPLEGLHEQMVFLLRALSRWATELHVIIYCKNPSALAVQDLQEVFERSATIIVVPYAGSMLRRGLVNRLFGKARRQEREVVAQVRAFRPDVVHLDGALAAGLHSMLGTVPGVISWVDPGSRRQMRLAARAQSGKYKHWVAAGVFYFYEFLCRSRNMIWHVVSDIDRQFLASAHPRQRTVQIPVALPPVRLAEPDGQDDGHEDPKPLAKVIIFADLRVAHLRESVRLLIEQCLLTAAPSLKNVKYVVLGRTDMPEGFRKICDGLDIEFVRWATDLENLLRSADFIILPDQVGTGLKNRAVLALSLGCATVGTPHAFEGIAVEHRKDALVVTDWETCRTAVEALATNPQLRRQLQHNAPAVAAKYAPAKVELQWQRLYYEISQRGA